MQKIIDGNITSSTWTELQLLVKTNSQSSISFGAGLQSAATIAICEFLSPLFASSGRTQRVFASLQMEPSPQQQTLTKAFETCRSLCHHYEICTKLGGLNAWDPLRTPSQRSLLAATHADIQHTPLLGDLRTIPFRKCLAIPAAKDWLNCLPSTEFKSWIPRASFVHSLNLFPSSLCPTACNNVDT